MLQECTDIKSQKKGRMERFFEKMDAKYFCLRKLFLGHPCIPRVRVNKGGDKRPSLRKKGRSGCEGRGGGEGAGQIQGVKG